jgi:hypothetical protein
MRLDGKPFYSEQIQLCHLQSANIRQTPALNHPIINFYDPTQSAFGEPRGTQMRGYSWEAENQRDDLVLGIAFIGPDHRLWFSGTHKIDPFKVSETHLGSRLIIKTYPTPTAHLEGSQLILEPDLDQ